MRTYLSKEHKIGGVHLQYVNSQSANSEQKRNESFWSYRLHKLGTPKVLRKDRRRDGQKGRCSGPTTRPAFAKATKVKNQFSYFSTNTCVVCTQRDSFFEHPNKCLNLWIRKYNSQFLISRELCGIQHL